MNIALIAPAGSGSKGDEAMMRGFMHLFQHSGLVILNPQTRSWTEELIEKSPAFQELPYSDEQLQSLLQEGYILAAIGADILDGSVGLSSSILLLNALKIAHNTRAFAAVFFSFRSDTEKEILDRIHDLSLSPYIHFFPREQDSESRFRERFPKANGHFFPDLAFYCPLIKNPACPAQIDLIDSYTPADSSFVALNFSEQSFRASRVDYTDLNRENYIRSIINPLIAAYPKTKIRLFSSDIRGWANFPSDYEYALKARKHITETYPGFTVETIHPASSFENNIEFLRGAEFLVTGRMHLAIAAFRASVIPIAITGRPFASADDAKQRGMFDKARGMFYRCIGNRDLVLLTALELGRILPLDSAYHQSLRESLATRMVENQLEELLSKEKLRQLFQDHAKDNTTSLPQISPETLLRHLRKLKCEIESRNSQLENENYKLYQWAGDLDRQQVKHRERINELQAEVEKLGGWGQSLDQEIITLRHRVETLSAELVAKTQHHLNRIFPRLRLLPSFIRRRLFK